MIEEICKLLNISRQTYYNWQPKYKNIKSKFDGNEKYNHPDYENEKENEHFLLIVLVKHIFKNAVEIQNFLDYSFIPMVPPYYYQTLEYDDFELNNRLKDEVWRKEIMELCGVHNYSNLHKFLNKRPMLIKLLNIVFRTNASDVSEFIYDAKGSWYKRFEQEGYEKFTRYSDTDTQNIISFLFNINSIKLTAKIIKAIPKAYQIKVFEYSKLDEIKFNIIKNLEINDLEFEDYVHLVNYINAANLQINTFVLLKNEIQRELHQILNYSILYENKKIIENILSLFPNTYNKYQFLRNFID